MKLYLTLPEQIRQHIWSHLLPEDFTAEEAAFMFVRRERKNGVFAFTYLEWYPVQPAGFVRQNQYHFELTDEVRAEVIKKAHDLEASLVELHSHEAKLPIAFSPTDFMGFRDFVPHVWWRLKGRPYLAVVISKTGCDGLVWLNSPEESQKLDAISTEKIVIKPTGFSCQRRVSYYG